jgi:hypothetical protein
VSSSISERSVTAAFASPTVVTDAARGSSPATEHRDFAQRIEGAEVDEDHVDGIRAEGAGHRVLEKPRRKRVRTWPRQDRMHDRADADTRAERNARIAPASPWRIGAQRLTRQEIQREQQQQDRGHLDQQLRQQQIRRR